MHTLLKERTTWGSCAGAREAARRKEPSGKQPEKFVSGPRGGCWEAPPPLFPCLSFQGDSDSQMLTPSPTPQALQHLDRAGHVPRLSHLRARNTATRSPGSTILRTALREPVCACPYGATSEMGVFAPGEAPLPGHSDWQRGDVWPQWLPWLVAGTQVAAAG